MATPVSPRRGDSAERKEAPSHRRSGSRQEAKVEGVATPRLHRAQSPQPQSPRRWSVGRFKHPVSARATAAKTGGVSTSRIHKDKDQRSKSIEREDKGAREVPKGASDTSISSSSSGGNFTVPLGRTSSDLSLDKNAPSANFRRLIKDIGGEEEAAKILTKFNDPVRKNFDEIREEAKKHRCQIRYLFLNELLDLEKSPETEEAAIEECREKDYTLDLIYSFYEAKFREYSVDIKKRWAGLPKEEKKQWLAKLESTLQTTHVAYRLGTEMRKKFHKEFPGPEHSISYFLFLIKNNRWRAEMREFVFAGLNIPRIYSSLLNLPNLQIVRLSKNRLFEIPSFSNTVTVLDLRDNPIEGDLAELFALNYPNLKKLYLGGTRVNPFVTRVLKCCESLVVLDLSRNDSFTEIPDDLAEYLPASLERLILDGPNKLTEVPFHALSLLTNLKVVSLRNVGIQNIPKPEEVPYQIITE